MGCRGGPTGSGVNGLHQVLQIRENVGIGFVPVLSDHLTIDDNIKLAVWAWSEFEVGDEFASPAQRFSCHPGSAESVASIPAVKDFQLQLFSARQGTPPATIVATS